MKVSTDNESSHAPAGGKGNAARSRAAATDTSSAKTTLRRFLRDPLLLFLLVGVGLFALYRWLNPEAFAPETENRIVITEDDLRQMSVQWLAQGRPALTPEEWQSLIEHKVREEVLYREALALGLDRDDAIIKRRLVQKMDFLAEDLAGLMEPTTDVLEAWYSENPQRFALPPRATFRHVYFSPDRRGVHAGEDARRALHRVSRIASTAGTVTAIGDPFMFQDFYGDRTPSQVAASFGPGFAEHLFKQSPGKWQGPIESGYGWHLVYVESLTPGRIPVFEEVEEDVRRDWIDAQRREAKQRIYEQMRANYEVELPQAPSAMRVEPGSEDGPVMR